MRWIAALVLAGCAASPTTPTGPGIASADFDDKLIGALCVRDVRCGVYASFEACVAAQPGPSPHLRAQRQADVEAGVVTYDPIEAASCIDFIASAACTDLAIHDDFTAPQACAQFEHGTIATGSACDHDEACASSFCEAAADGPTYGTCLAGTCQPIELAVGGVCGQGYPACPGGSTCVEGECRTPGAAGAQCYDSGECAAGLACDLDRGVCAPPVHEGEVCGPLPCAEAALDCLRTETDAGGNFVARCLRRVDRGADCRFGVSAIDSRALCKRDLTCDTDTATCVDLPSAGQPCEWGGACGPGATCVGSTCQPAFAAGAACITSDNCASGDCIQGVCQAVTVCST